MAKKLETIKRIVSWKSAELYTVGSRSYFTYNGLIYSVSKAQLKALLKEMDKENIVNPLESANYLIKQAKTGRFSKLHK